MDDRRKGNIGYAELFLVRFNELKFLNFTLFNGLVFKFKIQIFHNSLVIIAVLNVDTKGFVIVNGVNELEKVEHVDANNNFLLIAFIVLKVIGF